MNELNTKKFSHFSDCVEKLDIKFGGGGGLTCQSTTSTPRKFDSVSWRNSTPQGSSRYVGQSGVGVVVVRCTDSVSMERHGSVAPSMYLHFLLLVNSQQTAFAVVTKASRPTGIGSGIGCSIGDTDTKPIPLVSARYRYGVLVSV